MKSIITVLLVMLFFTACRKDKSDKKDNPVCNRITEINGRKIVYDAEGKMTAYTGESRDTTRVSYENNNKTIWVKNAGSNAKVQLDNSGYYIKVELYDATNKMSQSRTIGRNSAGYITDEIIELYKPDATLDQRIVYNYSNAFDANGNLISHVVSRSGYPSDTIQYVYDTGKPGLKFISGEASLLYEINPLSKNLLVREKINNEDNYLYTYTTDSKGRVIYNKCAALTTSGIGAEATIQYECN